MRFLFSFIILAAMCLPSALSREAPATGTPAQDKPEAGKTLTDDEIYLQASKMLAGDGVPHDPAAAVQMLIKSADRGHIPSMILVSSCCLEGIGTRKNIDAGLQIMLMAANKGSAEAQRKLAMIYDNKKFVDRDTKTAAHWFKKAADLGDPLAMYYLGTYYSRGLEVEYDPAKAFQLFSKTAYMDLPVAQVQLAGCYVEGFSVPKDLSEAYAWALVAADNGLPNIKNQLYRMMSQKILDKARNRADELKKMIRENVKKASKK